MQPSLQPSPQQHRYLVTGAASLLHVVPAWLLLAGDSGEVMAALHRLERQLHQPGSQPWSQPAVRLDVRAPNAWQQPQQPPQA